MTLSYFLYCNVFSVFFGYLMPHKKERSTSTNVTCGFQIIIYNIFGEEVMGK